MDAPAPNPAAHRPQTGKIMILGLIAAEHLAAEQADLVGAEAGYRTIAGRVERAG